MVVWHLVSQKLSHTLLINTTVFLICLLVDTIGGCLDPLIHLAIVFSSLILKVKHSGVSNSQLAVEDPSLLTKIQNTTNAGNSTRLLSQQQAFSTAWDLFLQDKYTDLRRIIDGSLVAEFVRFRQTVLQMVLATFDLHDSYEKISETGRKDVDSNVLPERTAQSNEMTSPVPLSRALSYVIQVVDISHAMQHWHVFQKWNRLLFLEMAQAFEAGRAGQDPSHVWYEREKAFLDNVAVPLAEQLVGRGIFRKAYVDELRQYATQNRQHWEYQGQDLVASFVNECQQ